MTKRQETAEEVGAIVARTFLRWKDAKTPSLRKKNRCLGCNKVSARIFHNAECRQLFEDQQRGHR